MPNHHIIHHDAWDDHFSPSKKDSRQERKLRSAKDRSKYKKTDRVKSEERRARDQEEAIQMLQESPEKAKKGIVTLIRSQEFHLIIDGQEKIARLRGVMKFDEEEDKNLVVVGDEVIALLGEDGTYSVESVLPRKSILCRQDNLNRVKRHLIAANIDQVFITTSIVNPHLRPSIIDRYLIAAQKGNIQPILLINKMDLIDEIDEEEEAILALVTDTYPKIGIPVLHISTKTSEGLEALQNAMKGHVSVFSGQSGSGKSSLINAILGSNLKTGETVERTRKGSHTTTFAQMLPIPTGGMCIDTPGIKSFGIWDLTAEDIRNGFPEFQECRESCQFINCWHRGEKGCGVEKEIEEEDSKISPLRYGSYLSLLFEIEEERKRR